MDEYKKEKESVLKEGDDDPWKLVDPPQKGKKWAEKNFGERLQTIFVIFIYICLLLGFLYLFICSLDFLSNAFRLLGGKTAGEAFRANEILSNPIADLMIGVIATVLLQSSSTTTSIVVAMVGSGILPIRPAIFIVMGANIGTSVTNTIVSLGQAVDRNEFRRAFAGATVHDMFNWLSVLILLPVEWLSGSFGKWKDCGLLCQLTGQIVKDMGERNGSLEKQELLKVITKPFTSLIVQIDKKVVTEIATFDEEKENKTLAEADFELMKICHEDVKNYYVGVNESDPDSLTNCSCSLMYNITEKEVKCGYMFEGVVGVWTDAEIGVALLILALGVLVICLIAIVKILHFLLQGKIALIIRKFLNSDLPCGKVGKHLTGYLAILIGAGLTILVQSSSIFTSAITPLVGVGVLHIERMYPLTLGANIGTTVTAIIASLAIDGDGFQDSFQIAMCHLFFNIIGIIIWYPVPFMRAVPIALAKILGNKTAKYRWFALVYLFFVFFIFPAAIFGLSLAGWEVLLGVGGPILVFVIILAIINASQVKCPGCLIPCCRDWSCCPKPLHSLEPYDKACTACCFCCKEKEQEMSNIEAEEIETVHHNGHLVPQEKGDMTEKF